MRKPPLGQFAVRPRVVQQRNAWSTTGAIACWVCRKPNSPQKSPAADGGPAAALTRPHQTRILHPSHGRPLPRAPAVDATRFYTRDRTDRRRARATLRVQPERQHGRSDQKRDQRYRHRQHRGRLRSRLGLPKRQGLRGIRPSLSQRHRHQRGLQPQQFQQR